MSLYTLHCKMPLYSVHCTMYSAHCTLYTLHCPLYNVTETTTLNTLQHYKKSRIRETKHLSTDADSSTDAIGGWTQNTPKPDFLQKQTKIFQKAKTQKHLEICQNQRYAHRPEVHREAWFPGGPRIPKTRFFLKNGKNHPKRKNSKTSRDMPKLALHPLTRGL